MPIGETYQSDSLKNSLDTIYGIENEQLIPIRHTEILEKPKEVKKQFFTPSALSIQTEGWQILMLLVSIVLVGLVKAFSNNRYRLGIKALLNYSVAQEITREEKVFFHRSNLLLAITYVLTLSLFLFHLNEFVQKEVLEISNIIFFLLILGFVITTYIIKYVFSKLLLFIFNDLNIAAEYIFNVSIYNNLFGVLLIPILCTIYFTSIPISQIAVYVAIPIAAIVFLFRLFRMVEIGKQRGVLYVYIFLYICSLEILPLVVLCRIFIHK